MPAPTAVFTDLGTLDYHKALDLQHKLVQGKIDGTITEDWILLVEHPSVFTLGRRGGLENLLKSQDFLNQRDIAIVQTQRGGNITYHGPGQIVVYPVFMLEHHHIGIKEFVYRLEEIMKQTAADSGITTDRNSKNPGLWAECCKLGSVGLTVTHGVTMHGFALNITVDLEPFSWINPCGLNDVGVTSIQNELLRQGQDNPISMETIKTNIVSHFLDLFKLGNIQCFHNAAGQDEAAFKI
ncbi:MAG: lipoyl(octanoyl) transferase LipB [Pseudomonadota bacterium]